MFTHVQTYIYNQKHICVHTIKCMNPTSLTHYQYHYSLFHLLFSLTSHYYSLLSILYSLPLGSWVIHYTKRHEQYEQWINKGEPPCLWLSGLHIPESYLTALVQTTCRMRSWPLDKSTLYTVVTKHTSDKELVRLESGM